MESTSQLNWLKRLVRKDQDQPKRVQIEICPTCGHKFDPTGRHGVPCRNCPRRRINGPATMGAK